MRPRKEMAYCVTKKKRLSFGADDDIDIGVDFPLLGVLGKLVVY